MSAYRKIPGPKSAITLAVYFISLCGSILLFSNFFQPSADIYQVIKVVGSILVKSKGALLKQGDQLKTSDIIVFESPGAKAAVISEKNGRFVISQTTGSSQGVAVRSNLIPAMSNISSRSGPINNKVDLQNYFKGRLMVLDETSVFMNPKTFPMNQQNFFFIRYDYKGEKIDKMVNYRGDSLLINRTQLMTIDNAPVPIPDVLACELFYYSADSATPLAVFDLVFPEPSALREEIKMLLDLSPGKSQKDRLDEIVSYLNEFYGKPDTGNLDRWLKQNLGFNKQ